MFERYVPYITVRPEAASGSRAVVGEEYAARWGTADIRIPVRNADMLTDHILNFLECIQTRAKPNLDVETGAKAQVVITLAVESYRQGKVLYFDEANWKMVDTPPAA